ncbi:MAG: hypothetical protein ACJ71Y_14285, partial [Blastococcus sp.]
SSAIRSTFARDRRGPQHVAGRFVFGQERQKAPPAVPKDSERGSGVGGAAAGGEYLRIYLKDHDAEEAGRRLFAALGGHRCKETRQEKTWTVFSSERSEWAKPPQDYARANIPFGDRLREVRIICTTTAVDATE